MAGAPLPPARPVVKIKVVRGGNLTDLNLWLPGAPRVGESIYTRDTGLMNVINVVWEPEDERVVVMVD